MIATSWRLPYLIAYGFLIVLILVPSWGAHQVWRAQQWKRLSSKPRRYR